uniref:Zf-RING_UBOX domain-containing protein n=1 Tax=Caenorhabditis tropicalis TaxID=1561998 RepID=A0A1I7TRI4_9PELO
MSSNKARDDRADKRAQQKASDEMIKMKKELADVQEEVKDLEKAHTEKKIELKALDETLKKKKICGHTVCQQCLYSKARINPNATGEEDARLFGCLECIYTTMFPLELVEDGQPAKNYSIGQYID